MDSELTASPAPSQYTAEDYNILVGKLGDLSKAIKENQFGLMNIAGQYTGANQVALITNPKTKQLDPDIHQSLIEYMDKLIDRYKALLKYDDTNRNRNRGGSKKYHRKTRRKRSSITDLKLRLSRTKRREGS